MPPRKQIFQFKITLKDIKPPIWRRIQVLGACTFWDLHVAIQDAMGWLDYHLHEFQLRATDGRMLSFGIPDEDFDSDILPGWKYRVAKYLSLAQPSCEYVYDFGDNWRHKVELEKVMPAEPGAAYPRCLKGRRAVGISGTSGDPRRSATRAIPGGEELGGNDEGRTVQSGSVRSGRRRIQRSRGAV
jgi:hypothetical protein